MTAAGGSITAVAPPAATPQPYAGAAGPTLAPTEDRRARALTALSHLARYRGEVQEEVRWRTELTRVRGGGADWFQLAEALDQRAQQPKEALAAYRRSLTAGGLSAAAVRYAEGRIKALTGGR